MSQSIREGGGTGGVETVATIGNGGIPIYGLCAVVFCFQWWRDVRVYPEGPECVVEIEDDHLGER